MPVSPTLAADTAKATLQAYLDAEQAMLAHVADRTAAGITASDWATRKLLEVQDLRRRLQTVVDELAAGDPQRIDVAIRTAYNRGSATAATDLTKLGASIDTAFGVANLATVQALAEDTVGRLATTHAAILRRTLDGYRDVIASTTQQVITGTATRRQAAQSALDAFARRGISGFVDSAGRSWDMASYAEMATRTAATRAVVAGHTERLLAFGLDLVIVSDSPQNCPLCAPWERKVLSITGRTREASDGTRVAGSLAEAQSAGLYHPGCTHSTALFTPGLTRVGLPGGRATDNPQGYADRQHLRYLERGVRDWKRRAAVAIDPAAQRRAEAHVRDWQARIRDHVGSTEAKRVRAREQIGRAR